MCARIVGKAVSWILKDGLCYVSYFHRLLSIHNAWKYLGLQFKHLIKLSYIGGATHKHVYSIQSLTIPMTCNTILHIFSFESKLVSCVDIVESMCKMLKGNCLRVGHFLTMFVKVNVQRIKLFTQKICISIKFFIIIRVNSKF